MSEETTGQNPVQATDDPTPPAQDVSGQHEQGLSPEAMEAELRRARDEAAKNRIAKRELEQTMTAQIEALQTKLQSLETEKVSEFQSELTSLREKLETAEKTAREAELSAWRLQVATEHGLSPTLASRLQGDTLEQLQADAQALAKEIPSPMQRGRLGNGAPPPAPNLARELNRLTDGHGSNAFDVNDGLTRGGIISNPEK